MHGEVRVQGSVRVNSALMLHPTGAILTCGVIEQWCTLELGNQNYVNTCFYDIDICLGLGIVEKCTIPVPLK